MKIIIKFKQIKLNQKRKWKRNWKINNNKYKKKEKENFNYIPIKKIIKLNKNLEYECIQTIEEAHYKEITCLIYLSKKNEIVSSSLNTEIKVWGWGKKINNNFKINFNRT